MRARFLDVRDGASLRSRADTDFHAAHERLYEHVFVVRIDMMLTDLDLECLPPGRAPPRRPHRDLAEKSQSRAKEATAKEEPEKDGGGDEATRSAEADALDGKKKARPPTPTTRAPRATTRRTKSVACER